LVHALSSYTRLGQQACAEQFDARSSIHLALERFKTANVSLDRSVAPGFRYCCFDGAEVLLQSSYKARQRMNASFLGALHPPAQRSQLAHAQEGAKVQNQFPHHREAGTLLFESVLNFCLCKESNQCEICLTGQPTLAVKLVWGSTRFVFPPAPLLRLTQSWSSQGGWCQGERNLASVKKART